MSNATPVNPTSAPPVPAITVKVNGQRVEVPRQTPHPVTGKLVPTTMLQACEMAGVQVPHYCYHPKLPVSGNCRMCLVEYGMPAMGPDRKPVLNADGTPVINKAPNPAISCATPISPGMEIYTNTPAVLAMRKAVLEFFLINHPLDCPICDQAGECKLQEYSLDFGQTESRFVEQKVHKPKQVDLGPRIMLDNERCILCTRCIRFTRDIVGDDALGIVNRGGNNAITNYPGRAFANNYTLNTVDICPVGALTSKDFRFQMRVWFLKKSKSLCASCGTGCNILIGSREDRIYRFEPRQNEAVNSCWMCDDGRLNYRWIGREDRLQEARMQIQGQVVATGWPKVLEELATRLKHAQAGSVAMLVSSRLSNEELYLLRLLARNFQAITDAVPRQGEADKFLVSADKNPNTNGVLAMGLAEGGVGARLAAMKEAILNGNVKTLLAFGEDAARHLSQSAIEKLELLAVSDILPNASTAQAHFLLPGCAHVEKSGSFVNTRGRVQKFGKAVEPPGSAMPDWQFLRELAQQVTGQSVPGSIGGLFDRMASEVEAFKGLSWAGLGETGANIKI